MGSTVLLQYREEDSLLDFKKTIDIKSDKDWLELTKDIMAFANTAGGYIIFGVENATFDIVGLDQEIVRFLGDANEIMKKVNSFIEPPITLVRSKTYKHNGMDLVGVLVPASENKTHIIAKDGKFKYPNGKPKTILHKGTLYVRRSAGNHLVDSRDLDDIIDRRFKDKRESLLKGIARVIEAPSTSEIVIVPRESAAENHKSIVFDDSPDALRVKSLSFSTPPKTLEEEIASSVAMHKCTKNSIPPTPMVWHWYEKRSELGLTIHHRLDVAKFNLLSDVPAFYWIQGIESSEIHAMLMDAISNHPALHNKTTILKTAAFLGKGLYGEILRKLGNYIERVAPNLRHYPQTEPRSLFPNEIIQNRRKREFHHDEEAFRNKLEAELDAIAASVREENRSQPVVDERNVAMTLDCYLYAQDNKYKSA